MRNLVGKKVLAQQCSANRVVCMVTLNTLGDIPKVHGVKSEPVHFTQAKELFLQGIGFSPRNIIGQGSCKGQGSFREEILTKYTIKYSENGTYGLHLISYSLKLTFLLGHHIYQVSKSAPTYHQHRMAAGRGRPGGHISGWI